MSIQEKCSICGFKGFKTFKAYEAHYKHVHRVTLDTGLPRLDLTDHSEQARPYKPMTPELKQQIVEAVETRMRLEAWDKAEPNPLIGIHSYTIEPVWDKERNIL